MGHECTQRTLKCDESGAQSQGDSGEASAILPAPPTNEIAAKSDRLRAAIQQQLNQ
jgi:hypothetical protein